MNDKYSEYSGEEFGLKLIFQEIHVRGTGEIKCVIVAQDTENEPPEIDTIEASSWGKIVETYPTLHDVIEHMFWSENWRADGRSGPGVRRLFIESISGHDGLYHFNPNEEVSVEWKDICKKDIVQINEPFSENDVASNLLMSFDGGESWTPTNGIQLKFVEAKSVVASDQIEKDVDLVVDFQSEKMEIDLRLIDPQSGAVVKRAELLLYDFAEIV